MARYLGVGATLKSPRTTRTYTVAAAETWEGLARGLRPPPHIIGVGGFGVTYRVVDDRGQAFAMKEYFPREHAQRGTDGVITPKRSEGDFSRRIYEEGLRRFVAEGHLLTSFAHPNVCRVVDAFDQAGTSYQVMPLVEGREALGESDTGSRRIERRVTLEDYLKELERPEGGAPIDLALIEPVLRQLLDAVEYIHTEGTRKAQEITGTATRALLHRDIKPSNVLIEAPAELIEASAAEIMRHPDTRALLIDFGSARMFRDAQTDDVSRSIGVVTEGYAPPELKDNDLDQQGPHSDIYSLAALVWRAFVGKKPTTAQLANGAKLADLALPVRGADGAERPRAPRPFLVAVDRALNAAVGQRPQSIAEWRQELFGAAKGAGPLVKPHPFVLPKVKPQVWAGAAAVGVAALVWFGSGGAERNVRAQAKLAYQDAARVSSAAAALADRAGQDAVAADGQVGPSLAKADEGSNKYVRFLTFQAFSQVRHGASDGDVDMGDRRVDLRLSNGSRVTWWCYRKSPSIQPDKPYHTYSYPDFQVDGEAGWACGIGHTHQISRTFTESRNPWRAVGDGYFYNGEVNDGSDRPAGMGQLVVRDTSGDVAVAGSFKPQDGGYEVSGTISVGGSILRKGLMRLNWPPTDVGDWSGEDYSGGRMTFRGREARDRRAGRFILGERGELLGGRTADGKTLAGRLTLPDGTIWYGVMSNADLFDETGAPGLRTWGRLESPVGVYMGQLVDGKPDGCGVWNRDGRKEYGYFTAGVWQGSGSGGDHDCGEARYSTQLSPSEFTGFPSALEGPQSE